LQKDQTLLLFQYRQLITFEDLYFFKV
jgi:hypothetical protein